MQLSVFEAKYEYIYIYIYIYIYRFGFSHYLLGESWVGNSYPSTYKFMPTDANGWGLMCDKMAEVF